MNEGLNYVETWHMSEEAYRLLRNWGLYLSSMCQQKTFLDNVRDIIEDLEHSTNFNYLNGGH